MAILKTDSPLELDPMTVPVVDAKSLFDHLAKEACGTKCKMTALELAVIRQSMEKQCGRCRWIPHGEMLMDTLTKKNGNGVPLLKVMKTGMWKISSETSEMEARREAKAKGKSIARPHRKTLKYAPGEEEMLHTNRFDQVIDSWHFEEDTYFDQGIDSWYLEEG